MADLHPVLTGEKVLLARVRPEDVPVMARHFANLELTAYLGAIGGAGRFGWAGSASTRC